MMLHYLLLLSSFHLMSPTNAFYTDSENRQFGFSAAADFGRWDNSSLEIAVNGIDCHEISIIVTNVGDGNMVRPVDYYVYFHSGGKVREGDSVRSDAIQVGSGSIGPLDNSGSNQSEIVLYTPSEAGYYVFEVDRPEGHPAEEPILSDNINLSSCETVTDDVYGGN
jgi:YqxM protein